MGKINIALMAGGDSSEREVSIGSAAQVYEALDKAKYNVFLIDVRGRDWTYRSPEGQDGRVDRNDFSLVVAGRKTVLDYALILIHGTPGEDGKLQGYFDFMGIPYSTCDMVSTVITFDKITCKRTVSAAGIPVARDVFITKGDKPDATAIEHLGLPLFVKPNASGSSCGVTKVYTPDQFEGALEAAYKESDSVLVEQFVEGTEIGCGVLMTRDREYVLPLTEIVSKKDFFDYQAKYEGGFSDEITPARIDESVAQQIRELSVRAYRACRCRGVVRVDFIIRERDGQPLMIEINSIPGMSKGSIVPQQAAAAGLSLGELFDLIIEDTYMPAK